MRAEHPLRHALREFVLAGGTPKEFAATHGHQIMWACRLLAGTGVRKYYLTPEEFEFIKARRAETRRAAA